MRTTAKAGNLEGCIVRFNMAEVNTKSVEIPVVPSTVLTTNEGEDCILMDRTGENSGGICEGYSLPATLQCLFLTNNRLKKIEKLEHCVNLKELVLRQNTIAVIEGLDTLVNLEELDMYMNSITELPENAFVANKLLRKLDLSFNEVRGLANFPSANFPMLEEVYFIGNKIKAISALSIPTLKLLELGDNRIRTMENLDQVPNLESLWLGRNKLEKIQNLEALTSLKKLSLQSNRIAEICGIDHLQHLEELYLSHNGLTSMDGIQKLRNLKILDLASNQIEHIDHLQDLVKLTDFWFNGNQVTDFAELEQLKSATNLDTVYLEGNPLEKDDEYYTKILRILPNLNQLDALMVPDIRKKVSIREIA